MVALRPKPLSQPGRMVYIAGCDGTGKTTQATLLLAALAERGQAAHRLWLRFPFRLSLALLAYARLRGLSWSETDGNVRHGYWDFSRSLLMRRLFPLVLFVDAALAAVPAIYWRLWRGDTIICERFALDMLVDLIVGTGDPSLLQRWPGRFYRRLIPTHTTIVLLDADAATIRARRADLESDHRLEARLQAFRLVARTFNLPLLSSTLPLEHLHTQICDLMELNND